MIVQIKSARLRHLIKVIFIAALMISFGTIIEGVVKARLPAWAVAEIAAAFPFAEIVFCASITGYFYSFAKLGAHDRGAIPMCWLLLFVNRLAALIPFCWLLLRYQQHLGLIATSAVVVDIVGTVALTYFGAVQLRKKVIDIMSRPVVITRWATEEDLDGVAVVDREVWGKVFATPKEQLRLRLQKEKTTAIALNEQGKVIAFCTILRFNEGELPGLTWNEITGHGSLSTHNPEGKWVYGTGLACTKKEGSQSEAADRLLDFLGFEMMISFTHGVVLGARIPGYHDYHRKNPGISPEEYVKIKHRGEVRDPELRFYDGFGLSSPSKPVIVPNYMDGADEKSEGYSALIWWKHPIMPWVSFPKLTRGEH